MYKIVLMRHGESTWNLDNRFTGWTDVDLTPKGAAEAKYAGQVLKEAGFTFDLAYTSVLKRAIRTLWGTLDEMDLMWLPVVHSWRLNERHYGALQGLNKAETAAQYGDEQVLIWRRSYDTPPSPLDPADPRTSFNDPRYAGLKREEIPLTECLKSLDGISDQDIVNLNIPNGQPLVYELDADLKPIKSYYLGDAAAIEAAMKAVASQGKSK